MLREQRAHAARPVERFASWHAHSGSLEEQTLLSEAREEGIEKGRAEMQRETAERLLRLTQMDDATIATITGVD